ncbi:hypothetical protein GTY72_03070 [Streptomyces sp. SID8378]|nr:hypothetical protein [Streptomyces sp. SID8378]
MARDYDSQLLESVGVRRRRMRDGRQRHSAPGLGPGRRGADRRRPRPYGRRLQGPCTFGQSHRRTWSQPFRKPCVFRRWPR